MSQIKLPARLESLAGALRFVADRAAESGFPAFRAKEIQLAVDEAVVNIIRHAYPAGAGEIVLRWREGASPGRVTIEIEDTGIPFDIRSVPPPDRQSALNDRKVGGLGVFLMTSLADAVDYRREDGRNILTLVFGPDKPAPVGAADARGPADDGWNFPLGSMTRETYQKGDVLFRAGDPADKMFYIARGSLRLTEIGKVVREGEVIGEMGILSPFQVRTASAVCEEDLEAYTVGREDIVRLFARDSALAFRIVHLCVQRFIENLRAETEAKERIQSELRIARDIQAGMLPRVFPPFPERTEFDLFAVMEPAREVGGDFYDFFFIDDRRLCVVAGDVSGKGVPAALFMAICKTLLKTEALAGRPPADVLARVNRTLIPDNEMLMFVTVALLILDVETGEIAHANGGHPRPFVSAGPERFVVLDGPPGVVLGVVDACPFVTTRRLLRPGETVFLYTDGVTEATDAEQRLFSDARLQAALSAGGAETPEALIGRLRDAVRDFTAGTPQSDDITMVALAYRGPAGAARRD